MSVTRRRRLSIFPITERGASHPARWQAAARSSCVQFFATRRRRTCGPTKFMCCAPICQTRHLTLLGRRISFFPPAEQTYPTDKMGPDSEDEWNEEPPWWKKTLKWLGWLALSSIVAAGFGRHEVILGAVGFIATWMLRAKLAKPQSETLKFWMIATIAGVGLFLTGFADAKNQMFWSGFTASTALLGTLLFFQARNAKILQEKLQHEIHLMGFDGYRKQKFEKDQKEFEEWCKKNPTRDPTHFRFSCLIALLLLAGCATRSNIDIAAIKAQQDADWQDHGIAVQTLPPGAIIDWNNDVVGVSPCLVLLKDAYKGQWPYNGYHIHTLRARWTDGALQEQTFVARSPAPKRVVFLHPNPSTHYPKPVNLSQR